MSQTDKPSLADIARKNNSARTSKFASSMVPAAPQMTPEVDAPSAAINTPPTASAEAPAIAPEQEQSIPARPPKRAITLDELHASMGVAPSQAPSVLPSPDETVAAAAVKPARRRAAPMNLADDILTPKAPDEEAFGKMTRIAEKHHELLRKIAFEHRKPMNTILYNLLEMLDQTYQRDRQKDV